VVPSSPSAGARRTGRLSRVRFLALLGIVMATSPGAAPGKTPPDVPPRAIEYDAIHDRSPASIVTPLSSTVFQDTISYGGTYWAPDSMRWEALRDSCWTFDTGVGSSINSGANTNKPVGYHQTMEGWYGIDQAISPSEPFRRTGTCAIAGSFSLWCGLTADEAAPRCWAAGQGYGNSWTSSVHKSFHYPGSGSVSLSLKYAVEAEPGFDYAYVLVDTTDGLVDPIQLASWDGAVSGTFVTTLLPGQQLPRSASTFRIILVASSDGSYSDEDGLYPTTCGLAAFDDVVLGGAVTDAASFESSLDGWVVDPNEYQAGDFSSLAHLSELPSYASLCNCGVRDSVLVFIDEMGGHDRYQDNIAASPWIDLRRHGDFGRPGRLFSYDVYANLPMINYVYVQLRARYYPYVCPGSGLLTLSPWRDQNVVFYYGEQPFCTLRGATRLRDYSGVIGPGAEQLQIGVGIVNLCSGGCPFSGPCCDGITNATPYFDNVSLGIYGTSGAPTLTMPSGFQDNFASDGLASLTSPGRIDINRIKSPLTSPTPVAGSVLGDTLVASCAGQNVEVRLVFRVRKGPFVDPVALATAAARWTPVPSLDARYGGTWYAARMDTAQQGANLSAGLWMSTFHESDPGFSGTDSAIDPADAGPTGGLFRLANDIVPDNLFTPGSRLDYFLAARYAPPDPRNPGGTIWTVHPDTTDGRFHEVEVLPSSADSNGTWNCTLYVDHHTFSQPEEQSIEEAGLMMALGAGGANAEGTRYDRLDVVNPSGNQMSAGRPAGSPWGMSVDQARQYQTIVWHAAGLSSNQFTNQDAAVLDPWLTGPPGLHRFWGSGDGLAQSMHTTGGAARTFLNNTLGVTFLCGAVRQADCPSGTVIDTTYCLPLVPANDVHFASSIVPRARGNGCAERQFDVLHVQPGLTKHRGQLIWTKGGQPVGWASVSTHGGPPDYKAVLDGVAVGALRTNTGSYASGCDDIGAALARTADVLGWFGTPAACPPDLSGVPDPGGPPAPVVWKAALRAAVPNPAASGTTRIGFVNAVAGGEVALELFDVTGRLIRTLVRGPQPLGPGEARWDGLADDGRPAAQGLYFYRMRAGAFEDTERLVVVR
jgi:hypothetical protein